MEHLRHIQFVGAEPVRRRQLSWPGPKPSPFKRLPVDARSSAGERMAEIDPFLVWLLGQAGLDASAYKPIAMQRRLSACLRKLRVSSTEAAKALLQKRPELLPVALSAVLIGVSDFFRDKEVFDFLRSSVLPALLKNKRALRICATGVSEGQELYSIAMLLSEAGALDSSYLLGIDCRADAIAAARAGVFEEKELAGVDKKRFFYSKDSRWIARPQLRRKIEWRVADLAGFNGLADWDLILFRNVAIYFDEAHSAAVWSHLASQLLPGGFLVTGKAEKPPVCLRLTRVAGSVYKKPNS